MASRRLPLLLMMVVAVAAGVMTEAPSSTPVTDQELAMVVVKQTSEFLDGPTGRAFGIQERFQSWIDALEQRISSVAFNAVNTATDTISQIPFLQNYFELLLPTQSSGQEQHSEQLKEPVLYLVPQSETFLYQQSVQPPGYDSVGEFYPQFQNLQEQYLQPDEHYLGVPEPHLRPQGPPLQPHDQYLNGHEPQAQFQGKSHPQFKGNYLELQEPQPQSPGHSLDPYVNAQEPYPPPFNYPQNRNTYPQTLPLGSIPPPLPLSSYPQSQEEYIAAQRKQQESVHFSGFQQPEHKHQAILRPATASDQHGAHVPGPPYRFQQTHGNSGDSSTLHAHSNAQQGKIYFENAKKRVFTEDGEDSSNDQKLEGTSKIPSTGPYYPDPVEGDWFALPSVPGYPTDTTESDHKASARTTNSTEVAFDEESGKRHIDTESSGVDATKGEVSEDAHSRHGRSTLENFRVWDLIVDDADPMVLFCPSGSVNLLLCAGDQLFDTLVKAPIESVSSWVSEF